jgi:hypothetical protein
MKPYLFDIISVAMAALLIAWSFYSNDKPALKLVAWFAATLLIAAFIIQPSAPTRFFSPVVIGLRIGSISCILLWAACSRDRWWIRITNTVIAVAALLPFFALVYFYYFLYGMNGKH